MKKITLWHSMNANVHKELGKSVCIEKVRKIWITERTVGFDNGIKTEIFDEDIDEIALTDTDGEVIMIIR